MLLKNWVACLVRRAAKGGPYSVAGCPGRKTKGFLLAALWILLVLSVLVH